MYNVRRAGHPTNKFISIKQNTLYLNNVIAMKYIPVQSLFWNQSIYTIRASFTSKKLMR